MNQNWIVENLNGAFSTWNGKLTELWGLVTTSPQSFKGGAVWGVMQSLHSAMVGIGYALIVLFFAISLFKNTMNFHELKRPEAALHYLIRFVAAKALVGYGMDIMLNIFSICNGVVSDMAAGMGGISQAMVALPGEMQSAIENVGFLASIPLWLVTILGSLFITVLSFVMMRPPKEPTAAARCRAVCSRASPSTESTRTGHGAAAMYTARCGPFIGRKLIPSAHTRCSFLILLQYRRF